MMSVFLWNAMAMKYEQEYGKATAHNDENRCSADGRCYVAGRIQPQQQHKTTNEK